MTAQDWDFIREQMPKMEPLTNKAYDFNRILGASNKYSPIIHTPQPQTPIKLSRKQENINKLKMTNEKIKSEPKAVSKKKRPFYQSARLSTQGFQIE